MKAGRNGDSHFLIVDVETGEVKEQVLWKILTRGERWLFKEAETKIGASGSYNSARNSADSYAEGEGAGYKKFPRP